jgi:hypothetical protein
MALGKLTRIRKDNIKMNNTTVRWGSYSVFGCTKIGSVAGFNNYNENFGIRKRWGNFIVLMYISLSRTLFQLLSYCHARKMYGGMDV